MKADYLRPKFFLFLERRAIPRHLEGKPDAQKAEMAALLRSVTAVCPDRGFQEWWPRFEDALDEAADYRTWPTVAEIRKASASVRTAGPSRSEPVTFDPMQINAGRIQRGEDVGDFWLYGRGAAELLEAGLVTEDELKPLRSKLFFAMRDEWGDEPALAKEAEYKATHAAAVEMIKDKVRRRRRVQIGARQMTKVNEWGEVVE